MTLNQYIEQLKKVRNNIDGEIERIVSHPKNKGYIGGVWKRNRYAKGFLPSLGEYTDSTKRQKRAKGKTTTPFNLFDEGEWYDTLEPFYNTQTKTLQMFSTRPRLDVRGKDVNWILIKKYSWNIMDFTKEDTNFTMNQIFIRGIEDSITPKGGLKVPGF